MPSRRRFDAATVVVHIAVAGLAMLCLFPLLLVLASSFTDEIALARNGYSIIPSKFSVEAYVAIFNKPAVILRAYAVTTGITLVGTVLGVSMIALLAYPLSRRDFILRTPISFMVFFTMLFNGGLVPYYILMTQYLNVQNTILALLLPHLVGAYYVLILRTYFSGLPDELFEAARVDGAGEWTIFWQIAVPLARPALATIALFIALNYWNDWTTALYFIRSPDLYPLQYLLYIIQSNAQAMALQEQVGQIGTQKLPTETARMAMAVLATGPASVLFLFFQKYLVRGVTLGAFK
ncbi:MAG: carbohydrate ABC transporter permease [Proteobacteria bacterium]|nr:carbohydrate ABC transporter permease [Pseudomonadota bacterium]HAH16832.1 sugar ABC transporter permease [Chloroflexota bacterium]NBT19055.1 carbohydrate ABC transporter permease [Pseudomonadota bacterium]NBY49685.1 carbohydrate ABC transporter permease [Pseudomonadota bacterium]NDB71735.1 carbohydrate ABC transporter permease [Pseudomonadota bacterium]